MPLTVTRSAIRHAQRPPLEAIGHLSVKLCDWAWGAPSLPALHHLGYTGAIRYLSGGNSKDITYEERRHEWAAGLDVGVVWETTAGRAGAGYAAGQHDGERARNQSRHVGLPGDQPLFAACDHDFSPEDVFGYFDGFKSIVGLHRMGGYGSLRVIEALFRTHRITFPWQTIAWSHGALSPLALIWQDLPRRIAGVDADPDWGAPGVDIGLRGPNQLERRDYASRTLHEGLSGTDVRALQAYLNDRARARRWPLIVVDGHFGPATKRQRHRVVCALGAPHKDVVEAGGVTRADLQQIIRNPDLRRTRHPTWLAVARARRQKGKC